MPMDGGDIRWKITADGKGFKRELKGAQGEARKFVEANEDGAQRAGLAWDNALGSVSNYALGIGTALTGAFVGAASVAISSAMDFQGAMAEVATLGVKDLDGLSDAVKDVSTAFGLDLTDSAKAAYQAISAGATEAETPRLLEAAAVAATAGVSDLTTAIELGTSVSNAFGKEISEVSDVYDQAFIAVKMGVTTFDELAASVGKLSPSFVAAGLSSDEMFAAVAALTKGGVSTAESVTYLNSVVAAFQRQGESAILETEGFAGALEWLKQETGGNQQKMLEFLGSTEAMKGVLALSGEQADDFSEIMGAMGNRTGEAQAAFQELTKSDPGFAWRQLKSEVQVLIVDLGDALIPAFRSVVETLKPVVEGLAAWVAENPALVAGIIETGAVLGPVLIVLGGALKAFLAIKGVVVALSAAGGLPALAAALAGPAGIIIAIGAAVVAVAAITHSFIQWRKAVKQLRESEVKLSGMIEKRTDQLERLGMEVDRVKLAEMDADEQITYLNLKQMELNQKRAKSRQETLKKHTAANADQIKDDKKLTDSVDEGTKAIITAYNEAQVEAERVGDESHEAIAWGFDPSVRHSPSILDGVYAGLFGPGGLVALYDRAAGMISGLLNRVVEAARNALGMAASALGIGGQGQNRYQGGPVQKGHRYTVGERGGEIAWPENPDKNPTAIGLNGSTPWYAPWRGWVLPHEGALELLAAMPNRPFDSMKQNAKLHRGAIMSALASNKVPGNLVSRIWEPNIYTYVRGLAAMAANARLFGGPVQAQSPYIVGEQGRELFVPETNGTIVPNDKLGGIAGSITISIRANTINTRNEQEIESVSKRLADHVGLRLAAAGYA